MRYALDPMPTGDYEQDDLTRSVIGAAFEVARELKYGLFEVHYARALTWEVTDRGHEVARELAVPVFYKGRELGVQRLDMVVDRRLIVEIKATRELHPFATRQLYGYLCSTQMQLGLLLHFGPERVGVRRITR